jgi:hypothetical protein
MSMRFSMLALPVAAGLLSVIGCAAAPFEPGPRGLGVAEQKIQGGYSDATDTSVVGIFDVKQSALCTGSLIAPNVVLTARHCVAPVLNEDPTYGIECTKTSFGPNNAPNHFVVTTKQIITDSSADHTVREVITPADNLLCGNDVAILILNKSMAEAEAVPLWPRVDEPLAAKEGYYAVGYGAIADDEAGTGAGLRRRRDDLVVTCVGDACPTGINLPDLKATEWKGDQGVCEGDSGGPALDVLGRVIGVTSRGAQACTSPVYGYVFQWAQWIRDATIHGASLDNAPAPRWATGWPTDPAYSFPVGDKCEKPEDCSSNRCVNDGVAAYCTRLCNELSPCDEGYFCDDKDLHVCFQKHPPEVIKENEHSEDSSGCNVSPWGEADPRRPVSWFMGGMLLALAAIRRSSGRGLPASRRG